MNLASTRDNAGCTRDVRTYLGRIQSLRKMIGRQSQIAVASPCNLIKCWSLVKADVVEFRQFIYTSICTTNPSKAYKMDSMYLFDYCKCPNDISDATIVLFQPISSCANNTLG
jgi:hypothetical protein